MARGKDLKKRKSDKYSEANSKKWKNPETKRKLSVSIKNSRMDEKNINTVNDFFSYDETILQINQLLPWTQGTNRKVFKNKKLYASILEHTKDNTFYGEKISEKIYFLLYGIDCKCEACLSVIKFISFNQGYSSCNNKSCEKYLPRGPASWKQNLSEDEYKQKIKDVYTIDGHNVFTEEWFIKKYGTSEGKRLRKEYHDKMKNVAINNITKFGKSSQAADNFFSEVLKFYPEGKCNVSTGEKMFDVKGWSPKLPRNVIFTDFCLGDKVVEYDGDYFHEKITEIDLERDRFLTSLGYKILRVKHSECKSQDGFQKNLDIVKRFLSE